MTPDTARLREELHVAADGVQVGPDLLPRVVAGGRRRLRRRRAAVVAGAVAAAVVAVMLVPAALSARTAPVLPATGELGTTQPSEPVGLPRSMAGYSYLTGSVSAAPPGRALALWQQGFGVELLDLPQALVVSAHSDSYRRVDLAERRGGGETQGDPGPMLLSPDGTHVTVGVHSAGAGDIALLDLSTADVERFAVPGSASVVPVAWSPDGRQVAYLADDEPTDPHSGRPPAGTPGVLDLTTGEARSWDGTATATMLAFSPDGTELAVQWSSDVGAGLQVASGDGTSRRDLAVTGTGRLAGPHAWSPDGGLLVTAGRDGTLSFVDAGGSQGEVLAPLGPELGLAEELLGWAADRQVVVAAADEAQGTGPGDLRVLLVDLDDPRPRLLATLPTDGSYGVDRFQLASALLSDLQVRDPGEVDRGPWPYWLQGAVALLVAGLLWGVLRARRRRRP